MRPMSVGTMLVGALVALGLAAVPASAQQRTGDQIRQVTIAARSCPSYQAITANRARNNIMESLKDLGADTPYGAERAPVPRRPGGRGARSSRTVHADRQLGVHARQGDLDPRRGPAGAVGPAELRDRPVQRRRSSRRRSVPLRDGDGPADRAPTIYGATTIELTRRAAPARGAGQQAVDPGRDAGEPDHRRRDVRVRRAALRDRQPQRRQRRVDLLPAEHARTCSASRTT